MSMNIYQIKIKLLTKIPKHEQVELTSSLLQHTVKKPLSNYPFFTDSKPFPRNKLQSLSYDEVVTFFFNNKRFNSLMKNVFMNNKTKKKNYKWMNVKKKYNVNNSDFTENQTKFENFTLMIQLLFPTTFPLVNNIKTSLSYVLPNKTENIPFEKNKNAIALNTQNFLSFKGTTTKLLRFLPNKFSRKFSYLNLDNTMYTITHVIWINDVMNHPIYKEILLKYNVFEQWKTKYEAKLDEKEKQERNELIKFILRIMQKTNNPLNFKKINIQQDESRDKDRKNVTIYQFMEAKKKIEEYNITQYNDSDNQSTIIDLFVSLINSFYSLKDARQYFTTSYENLNNIGRKIKEYELNRDINDYIFDLNFEYLNDNSSDSTSNERRNAIITKINNFFPEFNNFVKAIREMKNRKIDNPIWRDIINKIIQGEKDHNFQSLWNEINNCYSISDVDNVEKKDLEDEKERKERMDKIKNMTGGNNKCKNNNDELNVGFDILISEFKKDEKGNNDNYGKIPVIEIYLQIDTIKGNVNEKNMKLLNCAYNDIFLGNTYTNLLYNTNEQWNIKEQHMFFDAKNILEKNPEKLPDKKK